MSCNAFACQGAAESPLKTPSMVFKSCTYAPRWASNSNTVLHKLGAWLYQHTLEVQQHQLANPTKIAAWACQNQHEKVAYKCTMMRCFSINTGTVSNVVFYCILVPFLVILASCLNMKPLDLKKQQFLGHLASCSQASLAQDHRELVRLVSN